MASLCCANLIKIIIVLVLFQVVELDFLYPSEGIHKRWDAGYRITSCAATSDQCALVLSIPRRKPVDETQETLRTSAFPSTQVKVGFPIFLFVVAVKLFSFLVLKSAYYVQEKWSKNLYIASICYGKTVA